MAPRTILYTGKGGVGKTSVAAATARRCAAAGLRTLVLSTDPAHSLADVLETDVGPDPTPVGDLLWAQEVQAQEEMERNWSAVQEWAAEMLVERGANRIAAEELTVPPGLDELFSLLQIKRHHERGEIDVLVVDCAPTGETLRLLSFPDVARWWLDRVFPWENQILAAARPLAEAVLDLPLPSKAVIEDVRRLMRNLIELDGILRDRERVTVRLVMSPDKLVVDETLRTYTYLSLYGYLADAVVVNRVFPDAVAGTYFDGWLERQREHVERVRASFNPVPVLIAPFFEEEVVGGAMLDRLGETLFAAHDPAAVLHSRITQDLVVDGDGARLRLELPFADKRDLSLHKVGAELIVRVDGQKRTIMLPPALAGHRPAGASFADGALQVSLAAPDQVRARD